MGVPDCRASPCSRACALVRFPGDPGELVGVEALVGELSGGATSAVSSLAA